MQEITVGDPVTVTGVDGEESEAVVSKVTTTAADDYPIERRNGDDVSLAEYWRGSDVHDSERVVEVRYVKGVGVDGSPLTYSKSTYGFPVSRVEASHD